MEAVYIVGSIRSGTTILGRVLKRHPEISVLFEPFYLYDYHTGYLDDDARTADQATERVKRFVRGECAGILRREGTARLVVKEPNNSFRIPFIQAIHPQARFIHISRDPRDVALSIRARKRIRQRNMEQRSVWGALKEARGSLRLMRPRHWWRAIWFELSSRDYNSLSAWFNKAKWGGEPFFGMRPPGWRKVYGQTSDLGEAVWQWAQAEKALAATLPEVPEAQRLHITYEDLVHHPQETLTAILDFMGLDSSLAASIGGDLTPRSCGRWQTELNGEEQVELAALVASATGAGSGRGRDAR